MRPLRCPALPAALAPLAPEPALPPREPAQPLREPALAPHPQPSLAASGSLLPPAHPQTATLGAEA
eukprot:1830852-Rhodomonas_salina.1